MLYKSTRGGDTDITFEQALFSAYAKDGGLYVPQDELPVIDSATLFSWVDFSYAEIATEIVSSCVVLYPTAAVMSDCVIWA
jgi:threonine synthase